MAKVDELNHFPVCAIGDSMVAGLGDTTGRGWTGRLVESAGRRGLLLHVTNLGVRGDTSRMIVDRWDEVDRRLTAWSGTVVVCEFGANDVMELDGTQRVDEAGTLSALREMVDRTPIGRLLVVGPPPMAWPDFNERSAARSEAIGRLCKELDIPFVPTFDALIRNSVWTTSVADSDGAHPDFAGWEEFTSVVAPPIIEWISAHNAARTRMCD
ncbi:GDSL-type esterase/lipase family protein [Dietzia sp. Alg238-R159]|uniref:GDSL-type esterase/lipase family protein n=1 Tax=Dietzia sp. Alg238-R159 TaxID=2305986 RepID=UPI001F084C6A|nr:GDSL-type esterase/lipase family protein [Dietzia sp. Alg238-R159]